MKKLFQSPRAKAVTGFWLSSQNLNKIQRFLFYFLILFIPTQFGRHFWPDFSFIKGARIDYLSPTLYATDTLIILIFILSVAKSPHNARASGGKQILIFIFIVSLILGIFLSKSPQAGVYGLIKFFEFVFLGFYVAHNIKKLKFENILLVFSAGIIFESFLAIAQYLNHGSLQGIFYFFGERFFNAQTLGIANATLNGELFLRPYATFPHPNVLAGYLIVAMTLIFSGIKSYESRIKGIIFILTLIIGTIVLLLTLSRVAILLWLIVIGSWFMVKIYTKLKRKFSIFHILFSIFALIAVGWLFLKSPLHVRFTDVKLSDESIVQRESLVQSSIAMIKDRPILGVGLNNFLINLPSYQKPMSPLFSLQPVHNLFLLVVAETGLVGLIFFVWFIFKTFSRIKNHESRIKGRFIILSSILILGMFDHYFLTLQQGQLLLSFVLGLCWSEKPSR